MFCFNLQTAKCCSIVNRCISQCNMHCSSCDKSKSPHLHKINTRHGSIFFGQEKFQALKGPEKCFKRKQYHATVRYISKPIDLSRCDKTKIFSKGDPFLIKNHSVSNVSSGLPKLEQQSLLMHTSSRLSREKDSTDVQKEILMGLEEMYVSSSESSSIMMRLANENGYLSWCRNTYISSIVAVTVNMQPIPFAKEVSFLFLVMGGLKLMWGTSVFVYNNVSLREKIGSSKFTVLLHCSLAIIHALLWIFAVSTYLSYAYDFEDEEEEEDGQHDKSKDNRKSKF